MDLIIRKRKEEEDEEIMLFFLPALYLLTSNEGERKEQGILQVSLVKKWLESF